MFRNGSGSRSVHVQRASHHPAALAWIRQCVFGFMSTALSRGVPPPGTHGPRRTQGIPIGMAGGRCWRAIGIMVILVVLAGSVPASALPQDGDEGGDDGGGSGGGGGSSVDCLEDSTGSLWVDPTEVKVGDSVTLHWAVHPALGCTGMTQSISSIGPVDRSGSMVVQIMTPRSWILHGQKSGAARALASTAVAVQIPPAVTITSDTQVGLFVQAIATPGQRIEIQNHVTLDLSYKDYLYIAPGVQIIGGRSTTDPGPRLFTTTFPLRLFLIGSQYQYNEADNVRISGIRLEGAELGNADADAEGSVGITVYSSVNVEIDNNEISGWRGSAVDVRDPWGRINLANFNAVRVHDNFIHHNQHYRREGYGVSVGESGYALIEQNVFDYNRHAIATHNGGDANGYYAERNLVLANGGVNGLPLPYAWHTHIFDVHGTESCWGAELYCGDAGEKFVFRDNTILYTEGTAIKVRGRPAIEAWADHNVFLHSDEWGGYVDDGALVQNDPGDNFLSTNNIFGARLLDMLALSACDFNGDGVHDTFVATGATWWYYSGGLGQWGYLNTSGKRLADLTLGDVSGDGVCDVTDDAGIVYLGGVAAPPPPPSPLPMVPDVRGDTLAEANNTLAAVGFVRGTLSYVDDPTCNDLGRITNQSPAAGTHAAAGTPVNLSIGQRPSTPCL